MRWVINAPLCGGLLLIHAPHSHRTTPLEPFYDTLDTPLGNLTLEASERGLSSIRFLISHNPWQAK